MSQLSFPIKPSKDPVYVDFQLVLIENGIIQPSVLLKAYVLAIGFKKDVNLLKGFIEQIKSSFAFSKLAKNKPRQRAYLSRVLYNEVVHIEDALKTDSIGYLGLF